MQRCAARSYRAITQPGRFTALRDCTPQPCHVGVQGRADSQVIATPCRLLVSGRLCCKQLKLAASRGDRTCELDAPSSRASSYLQIESLASCLVVTLELATRHIRRRCNRVSRWLIHVRTKVYNQVATQDLDNSLVRGRIAHLHPCDLLRRSAEIVLLAL